MTLIPPTPAPRSADLLHRLTPRERQVLALMARGLTNSAICDLLVLSDRTIESHVRAIYRKLELPATDRHHRRVQAVLIHFHSRRAV